MNPSTTPTKPIAAALVLACGLTAAAQPCTPEWSALGAGVDSIVYPMVVFDDGLGGGPALYAGGLFSTAGGAPANRIAKWNGQSWSPLGTGTNNNVYSLAVFDDGRAGPALYAGGNFTSAGGVAASRIARWNGQSWSPLGAGIGGNIVFAMAGFNDGTGPALYVGGDFTTAGGAPASRIAKWNGQTWSPVGTGTDASVLAFAVFNDGGGPALYVGGSFTSAGGVHGTNRIAKWNGQSWSPLWEGLNNYVKTLVVFDDGGGPALYAGGQFTAPIAGPPINRVAKWAAGWWLPVGGFAEVNPVHSLVVFNDGVRPSLYAATGFAFPATTLGRPVTKYDGAGWVPLGTGTNDYVESLAVFDDGRGGGPALFAGGLFTSAGGRPASHVARWGCPPAVPCYANCDASTSLPILNVNDFICFSQRFAAADPYANCDASTTPPLLNVLDFICFQSRFAAGCL